MSEVETSFEKLWMKAFSDMEYLIEHLDQFDRNILFEDEGAGTLTEAHQKFSEIINKLRNDLDREEVQLGLLSKFADSRLQNCIVPSAAFDDLFLGQFPELDTAGREIMIAINFFITSLTQSEHKNVVEMLFQVHLNVSDYPDRACDLASNQCTPSKMIEIFLQSEFPSVFENALKNLNCSGETLRLLYEGELEVWCSDEEDLIIETLAQHRSTPIDILQNLGAEEGSDHATTARVNIGSRETIPPEELAKLALDDAIEVRTAVFNNPKASEEIRATAVLLGIES